MNKLLLSCIKYLIFVLKSSTEYNTNFDYHKKKADKLSLCSKFKIYVLIISTFTFAFKIIFSAVKKVSFEGSSYMLTQTVSFLSTCEHLLLNIKKLIFYNF